MMLVPITRSEARLFVAKYHRHNNPPSVCVFQVGLERNGDLVGVAIGGRPLARTHCDGRTIEILRVATDGTRNACSMLYGACCRASSALGYTRVVTYTLESESGASLKAAGFVADVELRTGNPHGWKSRGGARGQTVNLFGEVSVPMQKKVRWWRAL